ncbi:MAG: TRAP transporter large permease subunit, partial [Treponemataceae bacterium]
YAFNLDNISLPFLYKITELWMALAQHAFPFFIILFICFAVLGVPLFIVISAIAYIAFSQAGYVEVISLEVYNILTDKSIAAIPLFTIAGYILSQGSAGSRLLEVFKSFFGWFRGGTVIAAVIVATFFTTFTGVSGVTILALGSILTIVLTGTGYSKTNAQALVTVSGAIGLLFPPSVAIIMYGTINFFTIDVFDLFKGALIPGLMIAVSMIVTGFFKDKATERPAFSLTAIRVSLKNAVFELIMPFIIIFAFFSGLFTLLETASFAVAYAFCLETFVRRDYTIKSALKVIAQSIPITGGVLIILGSARGLSYYLIDANVPEMISSFIIQHVHSKILFLLLLNICLLLVGCLMDIYSAILIVSPLIIPVAQSFGISAVQTGVIFLMNLQLGFLTPPVGMDLFIASYAFNTPVMKVVKGVLPFLLVEFAILMLITYVPWFTTALL